MIADPGGDPSARARRFDALYRASIDPWGFRTSSYERRKYLATLDVLPRPRYRAALEVGCSIGELAARLRARADDVLGVDVSTVAVAEARRTHARVPGLRFDVREVPREWPRGTYDLVVLSEVLYFLSREELDTLAARVAASLAPGGHCVAVCWLGTTDAALDLRGDEAAERFARALPERVRPRPDAARRTPDYRLDLFVAPPRALERAT